MFNRKAKKAAKHAEAQVARDKTIADFEVRFKEISALPDAGARYIAFQDFKGDVSHKNSIIGYDRVNRRDKRWARAGLGVFGAGVLSGVAFIVDPALFGATVVANGSLAVQIISDALCVGVGGMFGVAGGFGACLFGTISEDKKVAGKDRKHVPDYIARLEDLENRAQAAQENILKNEVAGLMASMGPDDLWRYPELKEAFLQVACTQAKEKAPPPKVPQHEKRRRLGS